jgi:hypothetical protein
MLRAAACRCRRGAVAGDGALLDDSTDVPWRLEATAPPIPSAPPHAASAASCMRRGFRGRGAFIRVGRPQAMASSHCALGFRRGTKANPAHPLFDVLRKSDVTRFLPHSKHEMLVASMAELTLLEGGSRRRRTARPYWTPMSLTQSRARSPPCAHAIRLRCLRRGLGRESSLRQAMWSASRATAARRCTYFRHERVDAFPTLRLVDVRFCPGPNSTRTSSRLPLRSLALQCGALCYAARA